MSEVTRHSPGTFCWPELATSDPPAAKKFYSGLFGWATEDTPAGPGMTYTMLRVAGKEVGALYEMQKEQREHGVPPNWLSYVSVASADETVRNAEGLGGKVCMEPFDVMEHGRMAILQDPTGATFAVWQPRKAIGARVVNEPNTLCWNELDTNDIDAAAPFYTRLFGWTTKAGGTAPDAYTEFWQEERPKAGMMQIPKEWGSVPPNWLVYFAVEDCDKSVAQAKELGGSEIVPPTNIPKVGRFAVLRDPQGAVFAIVKLDNPA